MTERIPTKQNLIFRRLDMFLTEFEAYFIPKSLFSGNKKYYSYKTILSRIQHLFIKQLAFKTYYYDVTERQSC